MPKQQKSPCRRCRFSALCLPLGFEGMLDRLYAACNKAGVHDSYVATLMKLPSECLYAHEAKKKGRKDAVQKSKN